MIWKLVSSVEVMELWKNKQDMKKIPWQKCSELCKPLSPAMKVQDNSLWVSGITSRDFNLIFDIIGQ